MKIQEQKSLSQFYLRKQCLLCVGFNLILAIMIMLSGIYGFLCICKFLNASTFHYAHKFLQNFINPICFNLIALESKPTAGHEDIN
ncbi:unnamed protein product [Moneuplotes crassus]|uniref:Uncharacterized protein n=1 Tax=Euplotes crassus TaxID=5936 RepID=A0AAD1Y1J4_EUPCR|nr:unnamed protein product [Moneuplotes crassus]